MAKKTNTKTQNTTITENGIDWNVDMFMNEAAKRTGKNLADINADYLQETVDALNGLIANNFKYDVILHCAIMNVYTAK